MIVSASTVAEQRREVGKHAGCDLRGPELASGATTVLGDLLPQVGRRDEASERGGDIVFRSRPVMIELDAVHARLDEIIEATQTGYDRGAAGRHGLERREPER